MNIILLLLLSLFAGNRHTDSHTRGQVSPNHCVPYEQNDAWKFRYGEHYPNGKQAVDFAYGPEGTWKKMDNVQYKWNYYGQYQTEKHPFGKNELVAFASGDNQTTSRDANGHLLLDFNHDGELDNNGSGGYGFIEHSGRGIDGKKKGNAFNQFWYDDNFFARYMSQAYHKQEPHGLSHYSDFTRWSVIGGGTENWTPYQDENFDQLALNGLYYLSSGQNKKALQSWKRIVELSGPTYDSERQHFTYKNVHENYHLSLMKILADHILDLVPQSCEEQVKLLQHSVGLKEELLKNQQGKTGWISSIHDPNSLINTESITAGVLALGAMSWMSFEPGSEPSKMGSGNYFKRPYSAVSAVINLSKPGTIVSGPSQSFGPGKQQVDFFLRAPQPCMETAEIEVIDIDANRVLATRKIADTDMNGHNQWTKLTLPVQITNNNRLDFRVHWPGKCNVDVGTIRIR